MIEKTVLVILAPQTEEIEFVTVVDILRKAGLKVTVAGLDSSKVIECARQTKIQPDLSLSEVKDDLFDAVILPGGRDGSDHLADSPLLGQILISHDKEKRLLASICAASLAFQVNRIGIGSTITSYPTTRTKLEKDYIYSEDSVVVSGNLVTSRGPGTAIPWSLKIVEILTSIEKARECADWLLI